MNADATYSGSEGAVSLSYPATVNDAPDRAYILVGRVINDLKDRYTIIHAGNAESVFEQFLPTTQSC